ncbi:MAG: hypothetical protein ACKO3M_03550 [Rubrivivax sp.]
MSTQMAIEHDQGRLTITSVVVPTGPRPKLPDLIVSLHSAADQPRGSPQALTLGFRVQPDPRSLGALAERLRGLVDELVRAQAAGPASPEPLSFELRVGDLAAVPPADGAT